jgi:hypothetical protein
MWRIPVVIDVLKERLTFMNHGPMKVKEIHFFEETGTTHLVIKCYIPEDSNSKLAGSLETDLISFPWQPVLLDSFFFQMHISFFRTQ